MAKRYVRQHGQGGETRVKARTLSNGLDFVGFSVGDFNGELLGLWIGIDV